MRRLDNSEAHHSTATANETALGEEYPFGLYGDAYYHALSGVEKVVVHDNHWGKLGRQAIVDAYADAAKAGNSDMVEPQIVHDSSTGKLAPPSPEESAAMRAALSVGLKQLYSEVTARGGRPAWLTPPFPAEAPVKTTARLPLSLSDLPR